MGFEQDERMSVDERQKGVRGEEWNDGGTYEWDHVDLVTFQRNLADHIQRCQSGPVASRTTTSKQSGQRAEDDSSTTTTTTPDSQSKGCGLVQPFDIVNGPSEDLSRRLSREVPVDLVDLFRGELRCRDGRGHCVCVRFVEVDGRWYRWVCVWRCR